MEEVAIATTDEEGGTTVVVGVGVNVTGMVPEGDTGTGDTEVADPVTVGVMVRSVHTYNRIHWRV